MCSCAQVFILPNEFRCHSVIFVQAAEEELVSAMRTKTAGLGGNQRSSQRPILNGLPVSMGTHLRFDENGKVVAGSHLHFDDEGQVLTPGAHCREGVPESRKVAPSPVSEKIRLKGVPTPKGLHTRWS